MENILKIIDLLLNLKKIYLLFNLATISGWNSLAVTLLGSNCKTIKKNIFILQIN